MNDEGWWYQAVKGFFLLLKEQRWVNILYFSCIGHEDFDLYKRAALLSGWSPKKQLQIINS